MTRRSKKYHAIQSNNDDEKLQEALQDPNAQVCYDSEGGYTIEYKPSSPKETRNVDYFDIIYNIHEELHNYCDGLSLHLLDCSQTSNFYDLIREYIPAVREADDYQMVIAPVSIE